MARTVTQIQTAIKAAVRTYPSLNSYLFPEDGGSNVSAFNVIIYVVSAAMFTFETMIDILTANIQAIADSAPAGNAKWVQKQILNFQYGDVIQLVNFVPTYVPVDATHRIVTRCSVKQLGSGVIAIKVAKGVVPSLTPLSTPELTALKDYYFGTSTTQGIGFAGVRTSFINLSPDRLRIQCTVYFYGQYVQTTVNAAVIVAINNFLATFSDTAFDGTVYMIRLVDAIQAVPGVSRVTLESIIGRDNGTPFGSGVTVDIQGFYTTIAGYLIAEDTAANTLADTITMIEEPS